MTGVVSGVWSTRMCARHNQTHRATNIDKRLTFEVPPLLRGWKPAREIVWFYIAGERRE